MNTQQLKKQFILRNWNRMSGKQIAHSLKLYWKVKEKQEDLVEFAQKLFKSPQ